MSRTLLVADDEPLMREPLVAFLSAQAGYRVVGEAADGVEAVEKTFALRPDLVLMDLQMPRLNGVEATRRIAQSELPVRVVALTTFTTLGHVLAALRAGAAGFLVKDCRASELLGSLEMAADHPEQLVLSPQVAQLLAEHALGQVEVDHVVRPGEEVTLTEREHEALGLLSNGFNNREIAQRMHVSEGSVKAYLGSVCEKFDVRDRVQAVIRAYELGLVDPRLVDRGRR